MPGLPSKFDRQQMDRILQRAAELQAGERDPGEALSKDELLQLGRDVGIPGKFLEQAVIEEQTRMPAQVLDGFWDKAAGPAAVSAMRVIRGDAAQLERSLIDYMEEEELLTIARQGTGRLQWEPLKGFNAAMRRSKAILGGGAKPFMLARAVGVNASLTPLETGFVHVAIEADLREARGQFISGGVALGSLSVVGGMAMAILGFPLLAIPVVPVWLALGWGVLRRYGPVYQRTQMELERALDQLERGIVKPPAQLGPGASIVGAVLDEVRKAISSR